MCLYGHIENHVDELRETGYGCPALSPFRDWISELPGVPYLGYINWFNPMGTVAKITAAWVYAILLYYSYSAILRWLKMVERYDSTVFRFTRLGEVAAQCTAWAVK